MIIKNKHSAPKIIYRKKPWKIACMVLLPCLAAAGIGGIVYVAVKTADQNRIRYHIDVAAIPATQKYQSQEIINLTEPELKDIISHSFSYYNHWEVDTSKTFKTNILDTTSNATQGMVNVSTFLTLTNGRAINGEFQISGFKPQARPQALGTTLSVANTPLANILPTQLVDVTNPQKFDTSSTNYQILKDFLFQSLPNKPQDLTVAQFHIEIQPFPTNNPTTSYSAWDGYLYVKYSLDHELYKYPVFSHIVRLEGFKKYELVTLTPNEAGEIIIHAPASYNSELASTVANDPLQVNTIIANVLKAQNPGGIPLAPEDIHVNVTNIDNNNGQIIIRNLQINKFNPPLTYNNVYLRGFKIIRPILNNNKIDQKDYPNLSAGDITYNNLQNIIYKNLIIPQGLKLAATDLTLNNIQRNTIDGIVRLQVSIPQYIVEPFNQHIVINGFAIQRPKPLKSTDVVPLQYANYQPSLLNVETLKRIIFQIMEGKPSDLQVDDIEITSKEPNDQDGKIMVTGYIPKYQNRDPFKFAIEITGFKTN